MLSLRRLRRSPGWLTHGLAAVLLLITAGTAVACPLCFDGLRESVGQRLDTADRAVIAAPISGSTKFQVLEVIKRGKGAIGDTIGEPVSNLDASARLSREPFLLLGNYPTPGWSNLGNIRAEHADWLRQLIATRTVKDDRPPPRSAHHDGALSPGELNGCAVSEASLPRSRPDLPVRRAPGSTDRVCSPNRSLPHPCD